MSVLGGFLLTLATGNGGAAEGDAALRDLPLGSFVDAIGLEQLAEMVVTDTKVAQSPNSVTQKIVVLRAEDLQRQPDVNRNLAEWLRYTSGQFVNVLSRNDANWGSYAGLGPKYNSYLLDGLPIDSFVDAMSLDAAAIDRVEVHKGPASVLYANYLSMDFAGNEAPLAGTTNFILKDRVETPLTRLTVGAGSWGTLAGRVYSQGRTGPLSYILGASTEHSDYTQYGAAGSWLQTVTDPSYDKNRFFGNLAWELGRPDHTLSLFAHHTSHDGDMGRPNRDFEHRYDTFNFKYNNQLSSAWHIQFKLGERRYERDFGNDAYPASLLSSGRDLTRQTIRPMDLTLSYLHGQDALLTFGTDRQWVHYLTDSRSADGPLLRQNDIEARSTGYFAQEKLRWGDWVLRAGVRRNTIVHDYALLGGNLPATAGISWSKNLWSLGARYNLAPGIAFYGNAGSSFMTPAAKQIGGTVSNPAASGQLANLSLQPETGVGRDLGLDWQPHRTVNLGMRVFHNTLSSAIVDSVVSVTPSQSRSENAGSASATGMEIDCRYTPATDQSWFANFTRTRSKVEDSLNADQNGSEIPFVPDSVINLGMTARLAGGTVAAPYFHWVGRYYDGTAHSARQGFGNYGVINLRVQHPLRKGMDLTVDFANLGNRRYDLPWGFRDAGFSAFAALSFTL